MPIAFCLGAVCALLRTQRTRWKGRKLLERLHMEIRREQMETLLSPFSRLIKIKGRFLLCSFFAIDPSQLAATLPVNQCKIL